MKQSGLKLDNGWSVLASANTLRILQAVDQKDVPVEYPQPYGDSHGKDRILDILEV